MARAPVSKIDWGHPAAFCSILPRIDLSAETALAVRYHPVQS
jgi:hypothetical protein